MTEMHTVDFGERQMHGLVSIVLATYNGEKYLREQLESLRRQTYRNIEIIATDDCSTDSTLSILREFSVQNTELVTILESKENVGFVKNFEKGIESAKGKYVALCDQDDIWEPTKIERQVAAMDGECVAVFSDLMLVDDHGMKMGKNMWNVLRFNQRERRLMKGAEAYKVLLKRNVVSGCTLLIKRELAIMAMPFPDLALFVHDQWLALFCIFFGKIKPISRPLVKYRQHASQQTGAGFNRESCPKPTSEYQSGGYDKGWDLLFMRVSEKGGDLEMIKKASAWNAKRINAIKLRSESFNGGLVAKFLFDGTYFRYFSGILSLAKDVARVLGRR